MYLILRLAQTDLILRVHLTILPFKRLVIPSHGENTVVECSLGVAEVRAGGNRLLTVHHPSTSIVGEVVCTVGRTVERVIGCFVVVVPVVVADKASVVDSVVSCRDIDIGVPEWHITER